MGSFFEVVELFSIPRREGTTGSGPQPTKRWDDWVHVVGPVESLDPEAAALGLLSSTRELPSLLYGPKVRTQGDH